MGEPQTTVCRCCGQAVTSSSLASFDGHRQRLTTPCDGDRVPRPHSEQLNRLIASADALIRRAAGEGGSRFSSLELLSAVIASVEGAAIVARLGGDPAGLASDLGVLYRARAEALAQSERWAVQGDHDAEEMAALLAAAGKLAAAEAAEKVDVRHLLAAYAAPDCRLPGSALLRASMSGSRREPDVARSTHAETVIQDRRDDLGQLDRRALVGRDVQGGMATPALRDMADALAAIERTLASLGRDVVRISERLGQLERKATDSVRAARSERPESVAIEAPQRGGTRGETLQARREATTRAPRTRFTQIRRSGSSASTVRQNVPIQQNMTSGRTGAGNSGIGNSGPGNTGRGSAPSSSSTTVTTSSGRSSAPASTSRASGSSGSTSAASQALRRKRRRLARAGRRKSSRGLRRKYWQRLSERRTARQSRARAAWNRRSQTAQRGAQRPPRLTRTQAAAGFAEPAPFSAAARAEPRGSDRDQAREQGKEEKRFYLAATDDIVDAPGIGPRTAERFREIGILTVRDLLRADPAETSRRIATRWIRPETVASWQSQARLVCTVPWLRGTHAQLLVGAGYATLGAIVAAEPGAVAAAILRYAQTREGRSILRDGAPPEAERIEGWLTNAAQAEANRVA